ncbi:MULTISPECIES: hypothetical protein [Psychrobacillus]|uniref:Uncharacterized protein n=1 Tax=Psychrobacillus lasiicapitis TaxID=1636719 RepID=A0A544T6G4_9BACI|nr:MULTISPECIES: hypothetical protein [Psychrobacillus]MDI2587437.1 hypothetical protein [Psychrobacillus sp. NEAU-3TGS]TQR13042.1 hypothetical protein FG382_10930 [Psychrobacillus lasiicapitis]GGA34958.1 hypothetical protein GCM10011384_25910 [Psychrobacillus lasiicapitis]
MEAFIGIGCTVLGLLIGLLSFGRNRDKDVKADAAKTAVMETKLDAITNGVESIRIDLKAIEKQMDLLAERVARVEESSMQAHKRIDNLKIIQEAQQV